MSGTIIRPTMNMVSDVLCRIYEKETWILNDCAIVRHKDGRFTALMMLDLDDGYIYYGLIRDLHLRGGLLISRKKLDTACENFEALPKDVFIETVEWSYVEEGNRYYP